MNILQNKRWSEKEKSRPLLGNREKKPSPL
jgi:hypothetical protein